MLQNIVVPCAKISTVSLQHIGRKLSTALDCQALNAPERDPCPNASTVLAQEPLIASSLRFVFHMDSTPTFD